MDDLIFRGVLAALGSEMMMAALNGSVGMVDGGACSFILIRFGATEASVGAYF